MLYKPAGTVSTLSDPEGRPTIAQYLKGIPERVYPVGRLDYDAEGALLVTNDGDLAHQLMHPRYGVRRTYLAKVSGVPKMEQIARLVSGLRLEDGRAKALEAAVQSRTPRNTWIRLVVAEGRPHLVKRLMEAVGAPVIKLHRPDYGGDAERLRNTPNHPGVALYNGKPGQSHCPTSIVRLYFPRSSARQNRS